LASTLLLLRFSQQARYCQSHIDRLRSIVACAPGLERQSDVNLDALRIYAGGHEIGEMQEHIRSSSIGENESKAPVGTPPTRQPVGNLFPLLQPNLDQAANGFWTTWRIRLLRYPSINVI
jgi:hypothetical protein